MPKFLSLFVFAFHFAGILCAQQTFKPAYWLTLEKDTVRGLVDCSAARIRAGKCAFKATTGSIAETLDPGAISGFGFLDDDRFFESYTLPGGQTDVFAELLIRGRADLLLYDDFFYIRKDSVSEKIENEQMRISGTSGALYSHKAYIGVLNRYFSDCLPEKLRAGNIRYVEKDLVDVFRKYSECSGTEYHLYKDPKKLSQARKIRFHLVGGFNNSKFEYPDPELDIFNSDNNFFIGAGIEVPLTFVSEKLFLTGEAVYHRNHYEGKKAGFTPSGSVLKDYTLDLSQVKVPLGIRYHLARAGLIPYLHAGFTPSFRLETKWSIRYQGATEQSYDIKEKTASIVFWGGIGFMHRVQSNHAVFIELTVEKTPDFIGFYGPSGINYTPSSILNKMLIFGFTF